MRRFLMATFGVVLLAAIAIGEPSLAADKAAPQLVRPDGSYPTIPLQKDVVVVKVVQNSPVNLQKASSIAEGLATNVERMAHWINQACTTGKKPDFILFNEFPVDWLFVGHARGEVEVHDPDSGA
ncbi:MAG: hypothetical protein IPG25_10665 [Proteobacteria bacterium]|nr:hypothetical protein [Pseudomonadota bacterium]